MRDLVVETHRHVACMPMSRSKQGAFGITFRLGAYLPNGDFLSAVSLRRNYGLSERPVQLPVSREMVGDFVYGGLLRAHFGHFLLESLARIWALQRYPNLRIAWHFEGERRLAAWQADIFALLGIDVERFHFVDEPTQFGRLHIPEVGYRIQDWAHPQHMAALARYDFGSPTPGEKLWLSRARLVETAGNVRGVESFEEQLEARGWRVIHSQELSIGEQLRRLSKAEVIGGFEGSALHTLVLGANVKARVLIVPRGETHNLNYATIASVKGLNQAIVPAALRHLGGKGPGSQYELADAAALVDALCKA